MAFFFPVICKALQHKATAVGTEHHLLEVCMRLSFLNKPHNSLIQILVRPDLFTKACDVISFPTEPSGMKFV